MEKDPIRGQDSFVTFEEILKEAVSRDVSCINFVSVVTTNRSVLANDLAPVSLCTLDIFLGLISLVAENAHG